MEFSYSPLETVITNEEVAKALPRVLERLNAKRILLMASSNLSESTQQFSELRNSIGNHQVDLFDSIGTHSPRGDVLQALKFARDFEPDLLVSLGGGSIIDATKAVQLGIEQGITNQNQMLSYAKMADGSCGPRWGDVKFFTDPRLYTAYS